MEQALVWNKNHCNRYSLHRCSFTLPGRFATTTLQQYLIHCLTISDVETLHFFAHHWKGRIFDNRSAIVAVYADGQYGWCGNYEDIQERRYSTVYTMFECIIQLFISNVVLIVFAYPLIVFKVLPSVLFVGFGLSPLIFNFMWQSYALNPTKQITLCGIPYSFSAIYLPWIYLTLSFFVGLPYGANIIYCLLGWYQHCYRNRSLLALPYAFYKKIEKIIPNLIRNMGGYMKIEDTKVYLKTICAVGCCDIDWRRNVEESNT